jgi:hypothetical protein
MSFTTVQTHPGQTPATEYTITTVSGKTLVMVENEARPGKVYFSGTTRYHEKPVFLAGCEKVKTEGGTVTERKGFDFA